MHTSDHSHEVQKFSHEELRAGLIYYVSRNLNLDMGEQLHDTLQYMLHVPDTGVQPAEGTLHLSLVKDSDIAEDDAKTPRHLRPDLPPPFIFGTSGTDAPIYKSSGVLLGIPEDYLLMMMAATVAVITIITVFTVTRCARRRPPDKRGDIGMDTDVATVPAVMPTDSRPKLTTKETMLELECRPSDQTSSPPRPGRHHLDHHLHQNGGTGGLGIAAHLTDSGVSWPQEISQDISSAVPQYKV